MRSVNEQHEPDFWAGFYNGDEKTYHRIYHQHREPFLEWAKKGFQLSHEKALDVYQDAVATLYIEAKKGNYDPEVSSLRTYLFGIGKRLVYVQYRQDEKQLAATYSADDVAQIPDDTEAAENEAIQERAEQALRKLSAGYRKLLELYYLEGCSMEEIAKRLGYRNSDAVKATKHRCFCYIRKML
jgi:RNA polymerase sigma factor (sigma-70 family)